MHPKLSLPESEVLCSTLVVQPNMSRNCIPEMVVQIGKLILSFTLYIEACTQIVSVVVHIQLFSFYFLIVYGDLSFGFVFVP